jgi:hypothetical protein
MRLTACLTLLVLATGCDREPPSAEQVEEARARVELAMAAAHQGRVALELLGILPVYTCGEQRRTFVGRIANDLQAQVQCLTVTTEARTATSDAVMMTFPESGCSVRGHTLSGQVAFLYTGGEDRMELSADLRNLKVDGLSLQATVGYGTCGDEKRYWGKANGGLPGHSGYTYSVDGRVAVREGPPLIGGTTLILDGPAQVSGPEGNDTVTLTALRYQLGEYLPEEGKLLVETATGHRVQAHFRPWLWRVGKVELEIDDRAPITTPILR